MTFKLPLRDYWYRFHIKGIKLLSEGAKEINFPHQKMKYIKAEVVTMIPEAFDDSWNLNTCCDKVMTLHWVAKGGIKDP